jgi:hypothetical protein
LVNIKSKGAKDKALFLSKRCRPYPVTPPGKENGLARIFAVRIKEGRTMIAFYHGNGSTGL